MHLNIQNPTQMFISQLRKAQLPFLKFGRRKLGSLASERGLQHCTRNSLKIVVKFHFLKSSEVQQESTTRLSQDYQKNQDSLFHSLLHLYSLYLTHQLLFIIKSFPPKQHDSCLLFVQRRQYRNVPNPCFRQVGLLDLGFSKQGRCSYFEQKPFADVGQPLRSPHEGVTTMNVVKVPSSICKARR